ncbi:hypothetical protein BKA66DRAFT_480077 [Pyrenochaeta sp. MPI-SDFR-AT-0127]|nr:hypothetical protein BKA66DRAFT_480077 [Pyrenochaeta sp. MPI-SDFR-AT-0127]
MSFEEYDEFLNFSPNFDSNGYSCSPSATIKRHAISEQGDADTSNEASGDEDGLNDDGPSCHIEDDFSEGSFGDEEQVVVASDQYSWKIDHAKGDHKFKAQDFVATTKSTSFDGSQAIDMLQRRYTIDYGSKKAGSRAAAADDEYIRSFFLDLLIIIGRPLKPITQPSNRFFDNITISFKNWRASYSAKHVHGLSFDLEHRTFRLATAATRESWYIVMHPIANAPEELLSRNERRKRREKSSQSSALHFHHAQFLASYIKEIFLIGELLGEGVEPSWKLDGHHTQKITFNKWTTFQEIFMQEWLEYVRHNTQDTFWAENQPAFHAYDYGANIEIDVAEQLRSVPKEARLRSVEEDSESDEESLDAEDSVFEYDERLSGEVPGAGSTSPVGYDYRSLFTGGLQQLRTELEQKYVLDSIDTVSYALAVDINCLDGRSPDPYSKLARCLLADRNMVLREFHGERDFTFYPLAFHPAYGNFSSPRPPAFLMDNLLAVMQENMSYQHNGASVLNYGYFQGYSNIKRSIRHGPDDLLATKGVATAALALPNRDGKLSARVSARRERLLQHLRGNLTPHDPESSKPFARERQRTERAIFEEEFAFRIEQVLSVQVSRLSDRSRGFSTVLTPIFQLIRFFLEEPQCYTHIFRSFRPSVFPGILASFANLFSQAIDSIFMRFEAAGSQGLCVALAEGVSALDRLGSYCFTGFPRSLMGSVLTPLGTIDGIEQGGWPFIDPRVLDLRGAGNFSLAQWPRHKNGRPILMHIASIAFHYGLEVAASCHSELWFNELGGLRVQGPSSADKFLKEVLLELWKPQMIAFVTYHFHRALNKGRRSEGLSSGQGTLQLLEDHREQVRRWTQAENPFSWEEYEPIFLLFSSGAASTPSVPSSRTRRDFAQDLYDSCIRCDQTAGRAFYSKNATWFSVLRAALRHTTVKTMSKDQWVGALTVAMLSCRIECMPGSYQSKLSYRRVIRLVGSAPSALAIAARPGSLKRAAIEAEHRAKRPANRRRVIDFGYSIPFNTIPQLIEDGFRQQEQNFRKGNQSILEHYQVARQCLGECVTPTIAPKARQFSVGPKKDSSMFAANLVTRMLWFSQPQCFPWDADAGGVLRVSEMTKKIEHKGVNNRVLRELGWVKVVHGNRDSPRNNELTLSDRDRLVQQRRELLRLRQDAVGFIRVIFRSYDSIWVERCSLIVKEE